MSEQRALRVLIVEDEAGDARLTQLALQKCGFAVDTSVALEGLEALQLLRRQGERFRHAQRPDLILLDLKMTGLGGLGFLVAVKEDDQLCSIPVVIVTSSQLDADVLDAYRCGAAGYVRKSADFGEFLAGIRILGQYWFHLARLPVNLG